jgi:hypothetical protein
MEAIRMMGFLLAAADARLTPSVTNVASRAMKA